MMVAAAPSGPELIKRVKDKAPNIIYRQGWGMSETSPICAVCPQDEFVPSSVGLVSPNTELKIVDIETDKALGPNQKGELCVRGPQVSAYYN